MPRFGQKYQEEIMGSQPWSVQLMTRRWWFMLPLLILPVPSWPHPRLGDEEWMRRFRAFVKLFNAFVEALNEQRFDLPTWQRMRDAWKRLEAE